MHLSRRRAKCALLSSFVAVSCAAGTIISAPPASAAPNYACPRSAMDNDSNPSDIGHQLLLMVNHERSAHHLPAVGSDGRLRRVSSARHNAWMARFDTLSHRLPGEPDLGPRVSATGFPWKRLGESVAMNTDMTWRGACMLENWIYHEPAPHDGHRRILLDPLYTHIGISVLMDQKHHTMWITWDFATF